METRPAPSPGLVDSLRSLGDGLIASVQDRIALFAVELQEEKFRLIQIFVWISAAVFTGMMTVMFASLTLVYLFWETARLALLGGLTLLYARRTGRDRCRPPPLPRPPARSVCRDA